jgi:hypothetical protein
MLLCLEDVRAVLVDDELALLVRASNFVYHLGLSTTSGDMPLVGVDPVLGRVVCTVLVVATKPSACLLLSHPLVKTFLLTQVRRKEPVLETSGQFIEVLVHDGLGVVLSFVELAQDRP